MYLRWSQVPCRSEDIHPQRNERRVGEGAFWAANEAQGARDVGTTAQSGRQQGCHMGEAHRSAKHTRTLFPKMLLFFRRFISSPSKMSFDLLQHPETWCLKVHDDGEDQCLLFDICGFQFCSEIQFIVLISVITHTVSVVQIISLFHSWPCWGTWGTWSLKASARPTIRRSSAGWPMRWIIYVSEAGSLLSVLSVLSVTLCFWHARRKQSFRADSFPSDSLLPTKSSWSFTQVRYT